MCAICDERDRLAKLAMQEFAPCIVCGNIEITSIGTWVPDERRRLAAGGTDKSEPVFAYHLCAAHEDETPENEKLITQVILNMIRNGEGTKS